jgi:hypothetical protein
MRRCALLGAGLIALAACSGGGGSTGGGGTISTPTPVPTPTPTPTPTSSTSAWSTFVSGTLEQLFQLDPAFAVYEGRHEFDGNLPDWSDAGLQGTEDFWHSTIDQANAFTGLDASQQFERAYLIQVAKGQLFFLQDADQPHKNPIFYINGGLDPDVYLSRTYADAPTRMQATIKFLQKIPAAAAVIRANLKPPLALPFITVGGSIFSAYANYYANEVPPVFVGVGDAAAQQQLTIAANAAGQAMGDLAQYMTDNGATATQSFALGSAKYLKMLSDSEGVDTTIAELQQAGNDDLKRNQDALVAACAAYAPGLSVSACVGRMESNVPTGGMIAAATRQITELRNFVVAQDLVTIPSNDPVVVRQSPPYNLGIYFAPLGQFETGQTAAYFIPDDASVGEADLLFITAHEVMPGHFQQFLHSHTSPSLIGRIFIDYGFTEGWAHYSEEMLWEAGLRGTPEAHVGQLVNALLRNCRFLASIGLQTQGMTLAQAQTLFQQQCYQSAGSASQAALRGTYDPLYLTYTLGKLMIRRLRTDWTATHGGRASWKSFHDQFLSYGGPPIPMVRQQMMGEATPRAVF